MYCRFILFSNQQKFAASNQQYTGMPEYIKHMLLNTLQVLYIYNKNYLHRFSIFYNISIYSF